MLYDDSGYQRRNKENPSAEPTGPVTKFYEWQKRVFSTRSLVRSCRVLYYKLFKSSRTFTFRSREYKYFYHRYNNAWRSERTVEIPIIREIVQRFNGKKVLEVGNVLTHYYPISHDVVDKYEKAPGVVNCDVVEYHPDAKYDLIVTISTLEHVGWDEEVKDPRKIIRAVERLKECLAKNGQLVVTLPLGYNPEMDAMLENHTIPFTEQYYLKRISEDNAWVEVQGNDVKGARFNAPFFAANALVIGIVSN